MVAAYSRRLDALCPGGADMFFRSLILPATAVLLASVTALFGQEPAIAPTSSYPASLSNVLVADLNGDNAPEIIGLQSSSSAVGVLKNLGNGKYGAATYYAVSGALNGIAVGDFNGDGRLDVAVAIGSFSPDIGRVAVLRRQLLERLLHRAAVPQRQLDVAAAAGPAPVRRAGGTVAVSR